MILKYLNEYCVLYSVQYFGCHKLVEMYDFESTRVRVTHTSHWFELSIIQYLCKTVGQVPNN